MALAIHSKIYAITQIHTSFTSKKCKEKVIERILIFLKRPCTHKLVNTKLFKIKEYFFAIFFQVWHMNFTSFLFFCHDHYFNFSLIFINIFILYFISSISFFSKVRLYLFSLSNLHNKCSWVFWKLNLNRSICKRVCIVLTYKTFTLKYGFSNLYIRCIDFIISFFFFLQQITKIIQD